MVSLKSKDWLGNLVWVAHFFFFFFGRGRLLFPWAIALSCPPFHLFPSTLRMHLALKAYQELLATVNEMDLSPDEAVRESSRIIKSEALAWSPIPACPIS